MKMIYYNFKRGIGRMAMLAMCLKLHGSLSETTTTASFLHYGNLRVSFHLNCEFSVSFCKSPCNIRFWSIFRCFTPSPPKVQGAKAANFHKKITVARGALDLIQYAVPQAPAPGSATGPRVRPGCQGNLGVASRMPSTVSCAQTMKSQRPRAHAPQKGKPLRHNRKLARRN